MGARVTPGVQVLETANGILVRAGVEPQLGDSDRADSTPLLASVARAIEPVTRSGDNALVPIFGFDAQRRDRWERRFW